MSRAASRTIYPVWEWIDRPGLETATVMLTDDGVTTTGTVVTVFNETPLRLRYDLTLSPAWAVCGACLEIESNQGQTRLVMTRSNAGWSVNGSLRNELADCTDVDIMGSPLTNTLPIRRLSWRTGQMRDLQMAFIQLPSLEVKPATQRYTFLGHAVRKEPGFDGPAPAHLTKPVRHERCFEYLSVESGFRALLRVDAEGLVLEYPPYWRRTQCCASGGEATTQAGSAHG